MKRRNHLPLLMGLLITVVLGACSEQTYPMSDRSGLRDTDSPNKTSHSHHNPYEACESRDHSVLIEGDWVPCKDTEFINPKIDPLEESGSDNIIGPKGYEKGEPLTDDQRTWCSEHAEAHSEAASALGIPFLGDYIRASSESTGPEITDLEPPFLAIPSGTDESLSSRL